MFIQLICTLAGYKNCYQYMLQRMLCCEMRLEQRRELLQLDDQML